MKRFGRALGPGLLALGLLALLLAASGAQARKWSRTPLDRAQDYLTITDNRGADGLVVLIWLAPPVVPPGPMQGAVREMLDKYVVLAAVHARVGADNKMSLERLPSLQALDAAGKPLTGLNGTALPADLMRTIGPVQADLMHSFGTLGQGMQWFLFEAGSVHACAKTDAPVALSVPVAGETYTFATPVPGC